jgi:thioredoxin-like negative regulator of GroEL
LQLSIVASPTETYAEAYRVTAQTGRPMVVFVSAEWCTACKSMERKVIPQIRQRGLLEKVAFAVVNFDRERELVRKLIRGGPIPQLVMFRKTPEGWRRSKLIGGQNVQAVEKFIGWGLKRDRATRKPDGTKDDKPSQKPAVTEAKSAGRATPAS